MCNITGIPELTESVVHEVSISESQPIHILSDRASESLAFDDTPEESTPPLRRRMTVSRLESSPAGSKFGGWSQRPYLALVDRTDDEIGDV